MTSTLNIVKFAQDRVNFIIEVQNNRQEQEDIKQQCLIYGVIC